MAGVDREELLAYVSKERGLSTEQLEGDANIVDGLDDCGEEFLRVLAKALNLDESVAIGCAFIVAMRKPEELTFDDLYEVASLV